MATIEKFEDLDIWQKARLMCQEIYQIREKTNLKNDYKLYDQINRSSGSIMDNIAEGFERNGNKEFTQFLSIAKASCGETRSQLYRILDRKYITQDDFNTHHETLTALSKQIAGFMIYLKKSKLKGSKFK